MPEELLPSLADLVWPEETYSRATNVELDHQNPDGVPEYKFTAKSLDLLENVMDSRQALGRDRAWSIVGPYGSGKSTFGLLLLQLLTGAGSPWLSRCVAQLQAVSPDLARRVEGEVQDQGVRYLPIVLVGSKLPLDLALCRALYHTATDLQQGNSWVSEGFLDRLHLTLQTLEAGVSDSRATMELYQQASQLAQIAGYRGLLVVVDEFGKFLERAAWQGELPDLLAAQYLAELASSDAEPRVLFFVLLHKGFQHYASSLSRRQRLEWAKIQGRFRQVDFTEAPDNLYDLIAASLRQTGRSAADEKAVALWAEQVWRQVEDLPVFQSEDGGDFWRRLLLRVYPFHPLALYALPRLSARLGQNERTVFSFLASDDPLGFKRFLRSTAIDGHGLPSLTLDYLFDYFLSGSRFALLPPDVQRRISEIDTALDRLGDRHPMEVRLLKTLGALSILRSEAALPASKAVLAAALSLETEAETKAFHEALDRLLSRKIIVFRKFSGEYRIWQGSDFDFDGALDRAREEIQEEFDLSAALNKDLLPRPLAAHRHSFETGTSRYFAVSFRSAAAALRTEPQEVTQWVETSPADGLIVYLLPGSHWELQELRSWLKRVTEPRLLLVIPYEPLGLVALVQDLAALRRIERDWPELQDDPVAMKELAGRIEAMEEFLREGVEVFAEPSLQGSTWCWQGQHQGIADRRQLNQLLSRVCDTVYPLTPRIHNELINRKSLSSAVVVAVKKIIGGLLEAHGESGLGFTGNGPEVSIFKAVFEETGIYGETGSGAYSLTEPSELDAGFKAVWEEIESFLQSSEESAKPVVDLYQRLWAPPYGVREGLAPLLIWAVLIYQRQAVCLYEHGTYVREWAPEVFDRFVKAPGIFTVRRLVMSGVAGALVYRLNQGIPDAAKLAWADGGLPLASFLQNLYHWYQGLPDYAKHTLRLSHQALEFRKALLSAVDPIELVLSKLPKAISSPAETSLERLLTDIEALDQYVSDFSETVLEIASAYPMLCNQLSGC